MICPECGSYTVPEYIWSTVWGCEKVYRCYNCGYTRDVTVISGVLVVYRYYNWRFNYVPVDSTSACS